jgi:hypothetical protein
MATNIMFIVLTSRLQTFILTTAQIIVLIMLIISLAIQNKMNHAIMYKQFVQVTYYKTNRIIVLTIQLPYYHIKNLILNNLI